MASSRRSSLKVLAQNLSGVCHNDEGEVSSDKRQKDNDHQARNMLEARAGRNSRGSGGFPNCHSILPAYKIRRRKASHGFLFGVGSERFMVNQHNRGNKQVKRYSVDDFIDAMTELGLYEE